MSNYKAKEDKRQCLVCGESLAGKQKTAKFCSDEHRLEWHKSKRNENKEEVVKNKVCKFCSGEFVVKGNSRRVYCSDQCSTKANRLKKKEWCERKKNNPKKECLYCSKDITGKTESYCSKGCFDEARKKQKREKYRKENGLYNKYGEERKCKYCGKDISDRPLDAIYCDNHCGDMFRYFETTTNMPMDEYRKMIAEQKEQRLARLEIEIKARKIARTVTKSCEWCGNKFTTDIPHKLTCSATCRRKRSAKKHDKRINSNNIVDNDISLPRLYKRDLGICYLCHSKTDPTDIIRYPTYVIAGPRYPSIDHVIPIAKGGLHAWDNVKLACKQCNSSKSDTVDERELEEYLDKNKVTKRVKPNTKGKKVSQYTKDGRLIATYDSTVEAEKNTNVKRKGIQNCARGEVKSYGGFIWSYI